MAQFLVTTTTAAGPTQFSSAVKNFRRATVLACKALDGTVNVGNVKIGQSSAADEQPYVLTPGDEILLEAAPKARLDFSTWYFTVAENSDGLVIIYS